VLFPQLSLGFAQIRGQLLVTDRGGVRLRARLEVALVQRADPVFGETGLNGLGRFACLGCLSRRGRLCQ